MNNNLKIFDIHNKYRSFIVGLFILSLKNNLSYLNLDTKQIISNITNILSSICSDKNNLLYLQEYIVYSNLSKLSSEDIIDILFFIEKIIPLPSKNGEPDWKYMEDYIIAQAQIIISEILKIA